MQITLTQKEANTAFQNLIKKIGEDGINQLLFDWNDTELNEDTSEIVDSRDFWTKNQNYNCLV